MDPREHLLGTSETTPLARVPCVQPPSNSLSLSHTLSLCLPPSCPPDASTRPVLFLRAATSPLLYAAEVMSPESPWHTASEVYAADTRPSFPHQSVSQSSSRQQVSHLVNQSAIQ